MLELHHAFTEADFGVDVRKITLNVASRSAGIRADLMAGTELLARRPTPAEIVAAQGRTIPDLIAPGLSILFCGINPGLYSAAVGRHFARPGNRFWTTLHRAGITARVLLPIESAALLDMGCGITDLVARSSARAEELTRDELVAGRRRLVAKVKRYRPRCLAVLGISAYRTAFQQPTAVIGEQVQRIGATVVWVLPNPSGLNAHYPPLKLVEEFGRLRDRLGEYSR
jgi:TDG/mug DNA glycosylase family protein